MIDYYETNSQPITKVMVCQAHKKVRKNIVGANVDRMTWALLEVDLSRHLCKLWNRLSSGSYFPQPDQLLPKVLAGRNTPGMEWSQPSLSLMGQVGEGFV